MTTIADVAARAGVGIGTVSRVLNGSSQVRPETRVRVQQAMDELEYQPSRTSRRARRDHGGYVGVLVHFFEGPSAYQRLRGVVTRLQPHGFEVVLFIVDSPERARDRLVELPRNQQLDGLIVMSLPLRADEGERLAEARFPTGLIDTTHPALPSVTINDEAGGIMATNHLLDLGHERVAFVGEPHRNPFGFIASRYREEANDRGERYVADGAVVGIFSLEMSAEQLATRLIAEQTGIGSHEIRTGKISTDEYAKLVEVTHQLSHIPLFIDDTAGLTISQLRTRARRLKRQHNLSLIIIDYLQLLRPAPGTRYENRVQELSEITRTLKQLAKELNVPLIALSQLSRQVENREDKRPQLADLRESGSIEQDADVVMFIYRDEYYLRPKEPRPDDPKYSEWQVKLEQAHNKAEVIVAKQRHGPTGVVKLYFEEKLTRFGNLDEVHDGGGGPAY